MTREDFISGISSGQRTGAGFLLRGGHPKWQKKLS